MNGLNKHNCAYALDGTCGLDADNCLTCKIDISDSEFHRKHILGITWEEFFRRQQGGNRNKAVLARTKRRISPMARCQRELTQRKG